MSESCPKCSHPAKPSDTACARCGLLRSRWACWDGRPAPHPVLDPLWERALLDWQDERRHQALASVVTSDWMALSALSQRYRLVLRERPDDLMAKASLDRLIQLALLLPAPMKGAGAPLGPRLLRGAVGILLLLASLGLMLALWRRLG